MTGATASDGPATYASQEDLRRNRPTLHHAHKERALGRAVAQNMVYLANPAIRCNDTQIVALAAREGRQGRSRQDGPHVM
jgi:hypothetical protein